MNNTFHSGNFKDLEVNFKEWEQRRKLYFGKISSSLYSHRGVGLWRSSNKPHFFFAIESYGKCRCWYLSFFVKWRNYYFFFYWRPSVQKNLRWNKWTISWSLFEYICTFKHHYFPTMNSKKNNCFILEVWSSLTIHLLPAFLSNSDVQPHIPWLFPIVHIFHTFCEQGKVKADGWMLGYFAD